MITIGGPRLSRVGLCQKPHFPHQLPRALLANGLAVKGNTVALELSGDALASVARPRACGGLDCFSDRLIVAFLRLVVETATRDGQRAAQRGFRSQGMLFMQRGHCGHERLPPCWLKRRVRARLHSIHFLGSPPQEWRMVTRVCPSPERVRVQPHGPKPLRASQRQQQR